MSNNKPLGKPLSKPRGRPPYDDLLTPAEWRVVHAVQHGMSNREIANRFGISLDGVKFHVANAVGKLGLDNKQALKQWFTAPKTSALQQQEDSMNNTDTIKTIGQISRSVADIQKAVSWYRDVLGLSHLFTFGDLAFFDCDGTRLFLNQGDSKPGDESIIYFRVDDIQASHQQLTNNGVEFISAPHMIHQHDNGDEEWMAFFNDLEGRPLAIMATAKALSD